MTRGEESSNTYPRYLWRRERNLEWPVSQIIFHALRSTLTLVSLLLVRGWSYRLPPLVVGGKEGTPLDIWRIAWKPCPKASKRREDFTKRTNPSSKTSFLKLSSLVRIGMKEGKGSIACLIRLIFLGLLVSEFCLVCLNEWLDELGKKTIPGWINTYWFLGLYICVYFKFYISGCWLGASIGISWYTYYCSVPCCEPQLNKAPYYSHDPSFSKLVLPESTNFNTCSDCMDGGQLEQLRQVT